MLWLLLLGSEAYRKFHFLNNCTETIWVGVLSPGYTDSEKGGWEMKTKATKTVDYPSNAAAVRMWGRTGCTGSGASFHCETGDCGPSVHCEGRGGAPPVTLVEFTLVPTDNDVYDVSNVDGFNLPIGIRPVPGTYHKVDPKNIYDCGYAICDVDINKHCPESYLEHKVNGRVVACSSACDHFHSDEYCCPCAGGAACGAPGCEHGCPAKCQASTIANKFKKLCPLAYSYAYDDQKSTFTCNNHTAAGGGPDYYVTFCPK